MTLALLFAGALGIGFVSAVAGIGGGTLMVPYMVIVLGYDVRTAIATSLICIVVTSSSATAVYLRKGMVDLKAALLLEPSTAAGAILGAHLTLSLPARTVELALGLLLLLVSGNMIRKAMVSRRQKDAVSNEVTMSRKAIAVLASFLAGLSSGMFGIGGGVLKVPVLASVLGLPIKSAVATSSFMIGLTASSGGMVYLLKNYVDPLAFAALSLGIVPGATLGAKLLGRLESWAVRVVFATVLTVAALRLLYSGVVG